MTRHDRPRHDRRLAFDRLALITLLLALSACGGQRSPADDVPRVAYVTNCVASFWTIARAGAMDAGKEFHAEVDVRMPDGSADQKRIIQEAITRGVDGIAVSPIDPSNQTGLINQACAETRVITHDSDAPDSKRLCYVGMDNYDAGRMCGQLVKEALPDGGEIVILVGRIEQDNARRRRQGVIDELLGRSRDPDRYDEPGQILEGSGYRVLATLTDQTDESKAKANAEDAMARHPELAAMVGLFAYNAPMCIEALDRAGKLGQIKIIAFDEDDATLQGIRDGHVHGTVVQDPYRYGYESVRILTALARGDRSVLPKDGFYDIPARQIRKDNVQGFWDELRERMERD